MQKRCFIKHIFFVILMGKNNFVVIVHFYLSPGSAKQWRQSHSYCTFFQTNFHLLWFFIDTSYIYVFFSEYLLYFKLNLIILIKQYSNEISFIFYNKIKFLKIFFTCEFFLCFVIKIDTIFVYLMFCINFSDKNNDS